MIGFDTGFFVELLRKNPDTVNVWKAVVEGLEQAVCSCLSLFELDILFHRGALDRSVKDILFEAILANCRIVWIDRFEILNLASGISHGSGIHASDSLILACLISMDVQTIYTTDKDLLAYQKKGLHIIHLH